MKTKQLTLTAIFLSIILLFSFTPLGFINLGFIKATLVHVPVIIGAIILGPRIGAFLGLTFGILSIVINTTAPSALSFAFSPFIPVLGTNETSLWALVIALVPRILTGVIPFYVFKWLQKKELKSNTALFIAGVSGSLINTILVMNLIYFVFQDAYATAKQMVIGAGLYKAVLSVILINGVPEALIAGIATSAVASILLKVYHKNRT
ncbi:Substrate-specific component PanT of predicted pantothenate ECF transporter [Vagococcus fluvialis bH819]|uniref:Substrate-specific component PanT of predicted pantothenate ECF transporter n=1 Tax=Vagococcus fluvialis bH819 TaxID=1255619 RepID=A0A1X6WMN0_9ENTE|nr:Substrate-specific component PanT of predicted pantothenate ECF transporter [Vagococcus fluvialis bH819]